MFIHYGIFAVNVSVSVFDLRNVPDSFRTRQIREIVTVTPFGRDEMRTGPLRSGRAFT